MVGFKRPCLQLPWSNTNLDRILLSYATKNVTATFAFVRNLSQAKNFQDVVKIQNEFMNAQLNSFNDQANVHVVHRETPQRSTLDPDGSWV